MSLFQLPNLKAPKLKAPKVNFSKLWKNKTLGIIVLTIFISSFFGFISGIFSITYFYPEISDYLQKLKIEFPQLGLQDNQKPSGQEGGGEYVPQTSQEQAVIKAVKEVSPAVVSIIITKDLPILEEYYLNPFGPNSPFEFQIPQYRQKGTQKQEIGGGTGFLISSDGMVLTNRHVVSDKEADYTVLTNDGRKFPAKVLARDPAQDLAVLKIEKEGENFPTVTLSDSSKLQIGQTVITIGNALGEFRNTISVGVISGLGRTVTAGGGGLVETIEDVVQTDAAINRGNSGGPLLNLKGEIIGINTAMVVDAQSIGFAIPVNKAKKAIESVKASGKIIYPFLGVRYVLITEEIQQKNNLPVNYGALIAKGGQGELAVSPDSAAQKAGLKEGDIILEFNGEKITTENSLAKIIMKYNPGDKVTLKIFRGKEEKTIEVVLGERSE